LVAVAEVTNAITKWVEEVLSKKYPEFNNLPACPFARRALQDKKVEIKFPPICIENDLQSLEHNEVIIYVFDKQLTDCVTLSELTNQINQRYPCLVALEDHPDEIEQVGNVVLNQGEYALLLIQDRSKLQEARKNLKKMGYYNNWPEEYYKDVVDR
jgi:hypothetical protein